MFGVATVSFAQEVLEAVTPKHQTLEARVKILEEQLSVLQAQRADDNRSLVPVGAIAVYFGNDPEPPRGWLYCKGQVISDDQQYEALRKHLVKVMPTLQQDGKIYVPDLRGVMLRGLGQNSKNNRANRPGSIGEIQEDAFRSHSHVITTSAAIKAITESQSHEMLVSGDIKEGSDLGRVMWADQLAKVPSEKQKFVRRLYKHEGYLYGQDEAKVKVSDNLSAHKHAVNIPAHDHGGATKLTGSDETRPINIGINYIIKY